MRNKDGRLKRIEYRGKNLRASRTGGVALRHSVKVKGVNITANTTHGLRLSKRVAKGTNAGFQNGRFILRGRYGKGATRLNLSKSGATVSTRNKFGTYNWIKPKRSSFTLAGVNVRGKKAQYLQLIYMLVFLSFSVLQFAFTLAILALNLLINISVYLVFVSTNLAQYLYELFLTRADRRTTKALLSFLEGYDLQQDDLKYAVLSIYLALGAHDNNLALMVQQLNIKTNANFVSGFGDNFKLAENSALLVDLFCIVSSELFKQVGEQAFARFIFAMDECAIKHIERTVMQEEAIIESMSFNGYELERSMG